MGLAGKRALVTGSTSGIGLAMAAAKAEAQTAVKDLVGYNPYGRTRHTVRFQPGERGRIDPPALGGDKIQPKDPFGGVGRRRG